ncbi:MAG: Gmad2 immunoglobulin-like domain-containing protein [Actinomycetota bacterium]|nr:Gmad2 immunoglobulin-like domain-containing protein [Actinomycetota bacterium]
MRRAAALLLSLTVFAAACSSSGSEDRSVAASGSASGGKPRTEVAVSESTAGAGETVEATVGVAARIEERGGSSGVPFVASPEASGGSGYDADTMLAVRYGVHEGYERVVLDLGTGDKPAETVPEWTLMSPQGDGLLRVTLPSVSATGVSDSRFGDDLLKSFYVVRAPEGGMFVDVLARRAFTYRVLELSDPARLVVDFKPSGKPLHVPLPRAGGNTVLVEPRAGARIHAPLTVSGYSRNFEASNAVVLLDSKGEVVVRQTVESNDWSETWGYFEATLDLQPFGTRGTLRVGTHSARDGTFKGVEVPIHGT